MSFKIAIIGAGSLVFSRTLFTDIMSVPEFHDIEVAFTDINPDNLEKVTHLCQRDLDSNGIPIAIQATTDRREAFRNARYIINCVRIGGLPAFEMDVDIPLKYGVDQCVGDTLCTGRHTFTFLMAPMVHWPEVMVTYDAADKVLFSADAFGTFGALNGNIFADQVDFERDWLDDARRYYTNIVGKYGAQVQSLLKRAAGMEIQMICPLHGPIWRENLEWFLEKYQRWSTYTPEDRGVAIFCGSIYGHTENAAEILAARLAERGVKNISLYDVSHTDVSYLVSEAFRCSHLVLASATYNGEIYTPMENFLRDLACHGLRGRSVALIENGTWAARSGMLMTKLLEEMKEMRVMEGTVTLKSSVKEAQRRGLESLADAIADELLH